MQYAHVVQNESKMSPRSKSESRQSDSFNKMKDYLEKNFNQ